MLDIPRLVFTPSFSLISRIDSRVIFALPVSEETVRASGSTIMSFGFMPNFAARLTILSATASLPSAVSGIPFSSMVSATTTPPYFATRGNICVMLSSLPLTELTSGFPL